jgi:hypothetical protein
VKNAAGTSSFGTVEGAAGPTIASLGKQSDVAGNVLQINGANFDSTKDTVTINGDNAPVANAGSWTTKVAFVTIPTPSNLNVTETGSVVITDGNGVGTAPKSFTTIVTPTISSFAPTPGTKAGGTITLTGLHFTGTSSVKFSSSAKVSAFKVVNDTTLTTIVPKDAVSGDTIRVTNAAGHADSGSVAVLAAPTIDDPGVTAANPAVAGDTVTITGSGFVDTNTQHVQVFFGKVFADGTPSNAGHTLTVTVPAGAVSGALKVVEAGGTATSKEHVTIAAAPTVTTIPKSAIANGSQTITIKGKGFSGTNNAAPTVTFGTGGTGTVHAGNTATQLVVTVPANAGIGPISVTANTGTGTSKMSFTPIKTSVLNGIWPSQGQKIGGTLTITGIRLSGATGVYFQGVATAAKPKVLSDQTLTVVVPRGAISGNITVVNLAGTSNTIAFTVLGAPTFGSFDGTSQTGAGQNLVINGTNFINTDDLSVTVTIGKAKCPVTSINGGHTQLTCTIPSGLAGMSVAVTITTEAGRVTTTKYSFT